MKKNNRSGSSTGKLFIISKQNKITEISTISPDWNTNSVLSMDQKSFSQFNGNRSPQNEGMSPFQELSDLDEFDGVEDEEYSPFIPENHLFRPILDEDETKRKIAMKEVTTTLLKMAENPKALSNYGYLILRFAYDCPFEDISGTFKELIHDLESKDFILSTVKNIPSKFIKTENLTPDIQLYKQFFLEDGTVGNLEKVLCFFPKFSSKLQATFNFVMKVGPGPLPYHIRNYLAILASSRYDCIYTLKNQEYEFLENGGDEEWLLDGVENVPKKIQKILEFNAMLAHQPWLLNEMNIEKLLKGNNEDTWTISEIIQSILIFSLYYGYSGMVHGLGIVNEFENIQSNDFVHCESDFESEEEENQKLVEKLKLEEEEDPEEERVSLFEKSETTSSFIDQCVNIFETKKYIHPFELQYKDFEVNIKDYKVHNYRDYSWKDDAFFMLNRFYQGSESLIDSEFDYIYYLTENNFNSEKDVDTSRFRHAVWFYTHRLYGIIHDDFQYSNVNNLLNKKLKTYIKKIACYPQKIEMKEFSDMGFGLSAKEKVHINFLISEARKQSTILYGLRVVDKYLKQSTEK
eukprot:gene6804-10970_t